jgi:hypothetical protein
VIADIFSIIAPLFVIAGIGFVWGRRGKPFDTDVIGALVLNFGVPCLIFSSLTKLQVSSSAFGQMAGAYTVAMFANLFLGAVVLRLMKLEAGTYLPALTYSNNGNMGLPLCLFAFGEPGLALAMATFVISSVGNYTIGIGLVSGRPPIRGLFGNLYFYVIIAALIFMVTGARPPLWATNTVDLIGKMSIPLMLLALGVTLSRLDVASFPRSLTLALLRLAIGFALGMGVAAAFGFTGAARGVLILQCSMPVAVINYLYASRFNRHPEEVAGMIVISTAISFATLPLLLYVVL